MKRFISILLVFIMVLALCACGEKKEQAAAPKLEGLNIGFGRMDITPEYPIGLHGYGSVNARISTGVHTPIMATCVAITYGEETVLLYTVDIIGLRSTLVDKYRPAVSKATGIPERNILACGTHTHSGPSPDSDTTGKYWDETFVNGMVEAGKAALADRSPATLKAGSTMVEGMNFVRHYVTEQGKVIGDNFGSVSQDGKKIDHTTKADGEMQLIQVIREGKKDIVMVNWQGHAKTASTNATAEGRAMRSLLSADYIGTCRNFLEENHGVLFAFFLGASGNLNVNSDLAYEMTNCPTHSDAFGQKLGMIIMETLPKLTDRGQPELKHASVDHMAKQHSGTEVPFEIGTAMLGDIAFVTAPYEMFDTEGMYVKDNSPCEITFVMTVANGHAGYMPSDYAHEYNNCYEVRSGRYQRGTAEACAETMVNQLNALAGK